jgi:hypothetical protein
MPSITAGGGGGWRIFSAARGVSWLRRRNLQRPPFSSLAGGGGGGGDAPHLPVVIVGAGPVGLVLSFLLTKFGKRLNPPQLSSNSRFSGLHFWVEMKMCGENENGHGEVHCGG